MKVELKVLYDSDDVDFVDVSNAPRGFLYLLLFYFSSHTKGFRTGVLSTTKYSRLMKWKTI